jgi:hypothetical protein
MRPGIAQFCLRHARACGSGIFTLLVWTLWLLLCLLAAAQAYVATTRELELPGFVVREIEARLAASGMHADFGRTIFDPSGRVLVQDARLTLDSFDEPVATADAIYMRVRPWALIADRFEPLELRVTGFSLRVPSMLSPSGRSEEVVRDLDAGFLPTGPDVKVEYLTCRIDGLQVLARGSLRLGGSRAGRAAPLPLAELLAKNYARLSRRLGAAAEGLGALEDPVLRATLAPSDSGGTVADLELLARGLRLPAPYGIGADNLRVATRIPILGSGSLPYEIHLAADALSLPGGVSASAVRARVRGTAGAGPGHFVLGDVDAAAGTVEAQGITVDAPFASLEPGPLPVVRVEACGLLLGFPMSVGADADVKARTGYLRFDGSLAPGAVDLVSARVHRDLRKFAAPGAPIGIVGGAQLGPGWKFERATARVATRDLKVRAVNLDEARGRVDFDGKRFSAPEAFVRSGDSFARGSYEQDLSTGGYRFLLQGGLRPMAISSWFPRWWPALFGNFGFPGDVPAASVDLKGRWRDGGRSTTAFVQVDGAHPVVRGTALDRVRTILFIRPAFLDGIEVRAERGGGSATATFSRTTSPGPGGIHRLEFEGTSSLDPHDVAGLLGYPGAVSAAHLGFGSPPVLVVRGSAEIPKASGKTPGTAHVELRSEGPFTLYDWPLDHVALTLDLHGHDVRIDPISAAFAGGAARGRLEISGAGPGRSVSFAASCTQGSLGQAIVAAEGFVADRKRSRPRAASTFLGDKANVRFNLSVSADGRFGDPFSYHGGGEVLVEGAELGQVRMLGLLSELLKFTSLRFTAARGSFKIEGPRLEFPDLKVTGANSGIDAHGTYALDRHELDIKAKIYPFGQSKLLPEMLVGAVLAPLSEVFEMRLTGSVEKPKWSLAKGPGSLMHDRSQPAQPPAKPSAPAPAAAPPARS